MTSFRELGIEIATGATGEIRTICPQCSGRRKKSRDKCLAVNISEGVYFCHHCGWSGGLKDKMSLINDKPIAYQRPKYQPVSKLPNAVIEYFQKRGIPESILMANKIGYGPSWKDKGDIQFPYIKEGQVVNIKHRSYDKSFRQEKNAEACLYRYDEIAKLSGDTLIITEGEVDALSLQTVGFDMVTSIPDGAPPPGAKAYNTKFDFLKSAEKLLTGFKIIILAMVPMNPAERRNGNWRDGSGRKNAIRWPTPTGARTPMKFCRNIERTAFGRSSRGPNPIPFPACSRLRTSPGMFSGGTKTACSGD
jgi:twinkle protein